MSGLDALLAGGKPALARALARIEAEPEAEAVTALLDAALAHPRGRSLGLTGPPGVGKSTLIGALIGAWRNRGLTVGVIAVDPSSRRSGGALLGDRTRLGLDPQDGGVFVRSMAARDRLGGVAEITYPALVLMLAAFDRVIVETVGVGQSETEIAGICDTVAVCAQPGSGDALQFMKAGVMEIPDIVIVTKADLGDPARRAAADLRGALGLAARQSGRTAPAVLSCSAADGSGLAELVAAIEDRPAAVPRTRRQQSAAWLAAHFEQAFGRAGRRALAASGLDTATAAPFSAAARLSRSLAAAIEGWTADGIGGAAKVGSNGKTG